MKDEKALIQVKEIVSINVLKNEELFLYVNDKETYLRKFSIILYALGRDLAQDTLSINKITEEMKLNSVITDDIVLALMVLMTDEGINYSFLYPDEEPSIEEIEEFIGCSIQAYHDRIYPIIDKEFNSKGEK